MSRLCFWMFQTPGRDQRDGLGRANAGALAGSLGGRFGAQIPDPMEFRGCTGFDWAMAGFWF